MNQKRGTKRERLPRTIRQWLNEHRIVEIEAVVPDMTGVARGKILPAKKFREETGLRLPEGIFLQTVNGEYPDNENILDPADVDMFLKPDPSTIRAVPLAKEPTAVVIHDSFYFNGDPVDIAPRHVLRRMLDLYREQGWQPVVAPEVEFYLVKPNTDADYPLEPPIGRSGREESGRQSFSIDALNEFEPLFEDLYDYCEIQGIGIETLNHESGVAQMEINLQHGDAMDLADQAFLFKRALRQVALRHKIYGTFMAVPMENEPGSALHIHQSVVDGKKGHNIFSTAGGKESRHFRHFIGGLQHYIPSAMALLTPNVNSYRRLTPGDFGAPTNVEWGYDNRTAGFRIPVSSPDARRVENRIAGADANPYLAIAASLACGYLGMRDKLEPRPPASGSASPQPSTLPHSLQEAVNQFAACEPLREILGARFVDAYCAVKQKEYDTFLHVISSWEREHLLLNV
ncbi:MAG: glutamine synthetase family protein [Pseudomonadota bacterium]|nr:glutamine synthetase family protein [Pseudomonadota bacterium]